MGKNYTIQELSLDVLTSKQAWHYRAIPISMEKSEITVVCDSSEINELAEELEIVTGKKIIVKHGVAEEIESLLSTYYPLNKTDSREQNNYYHGNADRFLEFIIQEAKSLRSSDIHIEVFEQKCRLRIRVDGVLIQRYLIDKKQYPSLINKIKILSNLDIAEKRLPQDGRILFQNDGRQMDIRVSVLPTLHGEKIVLRLLNNDSTNIDLAILGFSEIDLSRFKEGIKKPNGILLVSGPTGSGKTTTLYATLKLLNTQTRNILTIEDPIEYTLEGVNQVQLKENIGLNFGVALRTFLRQDPDIIMLGEIRDPDTANMAIRAALTGHLVLSTIHTNSAWGIVSRLKDMGVAPYLLANTLNTAVAQRLIRKLCPKCKKVVPFERGLFPKGFSNSKEIINHSIPIGCDDCFHTGYKGRIAVYEVIPVDAKISELIKGLDNNVNSELKSMGVRTLAENALEIFVNGETSIDEIYSLLMQ